MTHASSAVDVGSEFAQKPAEPEVSAERWKDWQTGSAFLSCASPAAAKGDHCSAEMSRCPGKWHGALSRFQSPTSLSNFSLCPFLCPGKYILTRLFSWKSWVHCTAAAAAVQWWKTLGVSLGVGRLDLFALCCHYLALPFTSNVCAARNTDLRYCVWHLCAHGRSKRVSRFTTYVNTLFQRFFPETPVSELYHNHFEWLTFCALMEQKNKPRNIWDKCMHCVQRLFK